MRTCFRLPPLLLIAGLAGCAAPAPSPVPPPVPSPEIVQPQALPTEPFFTQTGLASFYGNAHDGHLTAGGQRFDHRGLTAAHPSLAFGTMVRVTNLANGRTVNVEVIDRGPHVRGRIIDLSAAAAQALDMQKEGITRVRVEAFRADQSSG
ncbi:MAG TPA: septal ring lytic transglycosylase RlpA family protein [Bryobacteraceae bacterium]|nr:septal ring lytic transglycosylase RlpA family protein [Bryobacteraceae bacterium]